MAQASSKKPKPAKNSNKVKPLGTTGKPASATRDIENYYKDLEKSGFIKVTKPGYIDDSKRSAYVPPKYKVTTKGNKYLEDSSKAYSKDPMNLRPKPKQSTRKKMGA
jgi:hypothetical protein